MYEPEFNIIPYWFPIPSFDQDMTEEIYRNRVETDRIRMELTAVIIGKRYDLGSWFALSQTVGYSIDNWLGNKDEFVAHFGQPDLILMAIATEHKEYISKQDSVARESEMQRKLSQIDVSNSMSAARRTNDALSKTYGN